MVKIASFAAGDVEKTEDGGGSMAFAAARRFLLRTSCGKLDGSAVG